MGYYYHKLGLDDDLKYLERTLSVFGGCIVLFTGIFAILHPPDDFDEWFMVVFPFINGAFIVFYFSVWNKLLLRQYCFRITDEGVNLNLPDFTEQRFIPKEQITKAQLIDYEILIYLKNELPERFGLGIFLHEQNRKMLRQAFRKIEIPVHDMMEGKVYA